MGKPGIFAGAAGMLIASIAIMILAKAIDFLGGIGEEKAGMGILIIMAAMVGIAAAAALLSPLIPMIQAFGIAIMFLGAGFALLGLGMLAGAAAFSIVIGLMSLGVPVLADLINNFIDLIPLMAKALYAMLTQFALVVIQATPVMMLAFVTFVSGLLKAFDELVPKIMDSARVLLDAFIRVLVEFIPDLVNAGWDMLQGLLDGIESHIGDITTSVLKIIGKFLDALKDGVPDVIKKGTALIMALIEGLGKAGADIAKCAGDTVLKFLQDITDWVNTHTKEIEDTTRNFVDAIIKGLMAAVKGLGSGFITSITGLASDAWEGAKNFLGINSPSKKFMLLGAGIVEGLVKGVMTNRQGLIDAVKKILADMSDAANESADKIKKLQDKIKDLNSTKKRTPKQNAALAQAKKDLAAEEAYLKKLAAAKKTIAVEHKKQINDLYNLGTQYDALTKKLEDARTAYTDAVKERDDYAKSIADSFGTLPTFDATTSLDDYFNAIRTATEANIKFKATMEKLRSLGLDDTSYKKFMEQGTEIQPFLDALLKSGGSTIAELGKIDQSLTDSATSLGSSAADALYKVGVDLAKGVVAGLDAEMTNLTAKMKSLGKAIADELRRELGIKSPSKVFAEIGKNTVKGLAKGIDDNTNVVDISARRAGQVAIDALRQSIEGLTADGDIDIQPVIAPVLDLTSFRKDAAGIGAILSPGALQASLSAQNASSISSAEAAARAAQSASQDLQATGTTVELTQINYSPKALSTAEIYRNTKNQLSVVKGALDR
jgi:hypothetical protein